MENFFQILFSNGFVQQYLIDHSETLSQGVYVTVGVLSVLLMAAVAYLLGSLNFAIIISGKKYKEDIRSFGSKNAGMTNMMRTYGRTAAGLTLLGDSLKAFVACLIGYAVFGSMGSYIAGLFCILGHMFPVFYRFRGGKGVVTSAVTILMCNPFVFLILFVIFAILVLSTKYISLGSVMCMLFYPLILDRINRMTVGYSTLEVLFAVMMTVLVIFKHKENIKRLLAGKESKFSFKKSVKADSDKQNFESDQ